MKPFALFTSQGGYKIEGLSFELPLNTTLPPHGSLVLVNFAPTNAAFMERFISEYSMTNSKRRCTGAIQRKTR